MTIELLNILFTFGGTLLGVGGSMLFKSGRRKASAEADKAVADGYEARITALHTIIDNVNKTEIEHAQRIAELNHSLDDKTSRIRQVEDRLVLTERENTRLAEENGSLKEDLANTKCNIHDCVMRQPPNKHTKEAIAKQSKKTIKLTRNGQI